MADAGIKVIVVNSKTDSTDALAMGYVGPNDVEAGEMLAQWVIDPGSGWRKVCTLPGRYRKLCSF